MAILADKFSVTVASMGAVVVPGCTVSCVSHERGIDVHAVAPGNPLYTEQCVFVAWDRTLGWAGEQDAPRDLWLALGG